jgi:hypothetical protein
LFRHVALVEGVTMAVALRGRGWTTAELGRTFVAALVPFGTFVNDRFLRERESR